MPPKPQTQAITIETSKKDNRVFLEKSSENIADLLRKINSSPALGQSLLYTDFYTDTIPLLYDGTDYYIISPTKVKSAAGSELRASLKTPSPVQDRNVLEQSNVNNLETARSTIESPLIDSSLQLLESLTSDNICKLYRLKENKSGPTTIDAIFHLNVETGEMIAKKSITPKVLKDSSNLDDFDVVDSSDDDSSDDDNSSNSSDDDFSNLDQNEYESWDTIFSQLANNNEDKSDDDSEDDEQKVNASANNDADYDDSDGNDVSEENKPALESNIEVATTDDQVSVCLNDQQTAPPLPDKIQRIHDCLTALDRKHKIVRHKDLAFIIFNRVPGIALSEFLIRMIKTPNEYTGDRILNTMLIIAREINFLHQRRVLHGDLNPNNIIISSDNAKATAIDFDGSVVIPKNRELILGSDELVNTIDDAEDEDNIDESIKWVTEFTKHFVPPEHFHEIELEELKPTITIDLYYFGALLLICLGYAFNEKGLDERTLTRNRTLNPDGAYSDTYRTTAATQAFLDEARQKHITVEIERASEQARKNGKHFTDVEKESLIKITTEKFNKQVQEFNADMASLKLKFNIFGDEAGSMLQSLIDQLLSIDPLSRPMAEDVLHRLENIKQIYDLQKPQQLQSSGNSSADIPAFLQHRRSCSHSDIETTYVNASELKKRPLHTRQLSEGRLQFSLWTNHGTSCSQEFVREEALQGIDSTRTKNISSMG